MRDDDPEHVWGASDAAVSDGDEAADYQRRLGAKLRGIRRSQGLRLQDVEERSDGRFKAVVVGSYERGDRAVSAPRLAALAGFYGVPVASLLPDDDRHPRGAARSEGVVISVTRLRMYPHDDAAALRRLIEHVQWLRGDYGNQVLSLRGDDLQTVAIALGLEADGLDAWLRERGLLAS
jgi:transcriptional regulator with XRE-family HTH domain